MPNLAISRRGFLRLFVAATAAIVTDPKVILADTSQSTTALATRPMSMADFEYCPVDLEPLPPGLEMRALAHTMAMFAREMSRVTGVPERMLFGSGGAPTEDSYYAHIQRQTQEHKKRWSSAVMAAVVEQTGRRYNKDMEVTYG